MGKNRFARQDTQGGQLGSYSDVIPKTTRFIEQFSDEGETDE
jgi:hypothetical protein